MTHRARTGAFPLDDEHEWVNEDEQGEACREAAVEVDVVQQRRGLRRLQHANTSAQKPRTRACQPGGRLAHLLLWRICAFLLRARRGAEGVQRVQQVQGVQRVPRCSGAQVRARCQDDIANTSLTCG